ncbi:MAG: DinB family protein [Vicinamibacterales bacterium]
MSNAETPQDYTARILSFADNQEPWTVLSSTAARLRSLIAGRTRDQLSRTPDPSRWSVAQILAHLADSELVAGWRWRSILAQDGVLLQPYDQNTWADTFRYGDVDASESLQLFDINRAANLSVLQRVDPALHANHGLHAERGRETIHHLVRLYAGHDLNHLSQIERLVQIA